MVFRGTREVQFCSLRDKGIITARLLREKPLQPSLEDGRLSAAQLGIWDPEDQASGTLRAGDLGPPPKSYSPFGTTGHGSHHPIGSLPGFSSWAGSPSPPAATEGHEEGR